MNINNISKTVSTCVSAKFFKLTPHKKMINSNLRTASKCQAKTGN